MIQPTPHHLKDIVLLDESIVHKTWLCTNEKGTLFYKVTCYEDEVTCYEDEVYIHKLSTYAITQALTAYYKKDY